MKIHPFQHSLARQLVLLPKSLLLTRLRFIGQIFLATILIILTLWVVDTLQQRDVLHFLTGGGRVLEEVTARNEAQTPSSPEKSPPISPVVEANDNSQTGNAATANWYYKFMGVIRLPVLIMLGILAPLALFLWNWESSIYTIVLKPYMMLLGAQAGSVIVGVLLLGEGVIPFIGVVYSGLRVLQIRELLDPPPPDVRSLPGPLRFVLRTALILWLLNAIALALHILWVTWRLLHKPGLS